MNTRIILVPILRQISPVHKFSTFYIKRIMLYSHTSLGHYSDLLPLSNLTEKLCMYQLSMHAAYRIHLILLYLVLTKAIAERGRGGQ
jgi:hypothetical protein